MLYRCAWLVLAAIIAGCDSGGGGGNGSVSMEDPAALCSRSSIEAAMNRHLQTVETDTDFALYLERGDGESYSFSRGAVSMQTFIESASTSKWVTATAILRLVDQEVLDLDDRPQDWLPGWPLAADPVLANITLQQLLSFTSGLQDEAACMYLPNADFDNCVENIGDSNAGSDTAPGSDFHYAGTHLQVAGAMAVQAGGFADWTALFADFKSATGLFGTSVYDITSADNPLLAGGMHWIGAEYVDFLRAYKNREILSPALSGLAVADHTANATISNSPILTALGEEWHYGFGLWHECMNATFDCSPAGTISSPGAYGAYPFINYQKDFFGLLARRGTAGTFEEGLVLYRSVQNMAEEWAQCPNP